MKACLVLQRRFSVMGHAIALLLKKKYGVKEFCGLTYLRSAEKFLKSQKDIDYKPLLVDEDLYNSVKNEDLDISYIKNMEKEYGIPNLWFFIGSDRHFMMGIPKLSYPGKPICSYEEMLKHLQVRFQAAIKMLQENKPDFIIFVNIGAMTNNVLYYVAKKMGIKTVFIEYPKVKNRITLNDNAHNRLTKINKTFDSLKANTYQSPFRKEALDFLREFRENPLPQIDPPDSLSFFPRFFRWAKFFSKYITRYIKERQWEDYLAKPPLSYFRKRITKRLRKWRGYGNLFEKPKENEDFAFFPLHTEPEIATLVLAPFYTNQIALIQNIAKSLPVLFKLYVKEHPSMLYYRPRSYYKELKKIPNLRLIDVKVSSTDLIKKAKIVLTITGAGGWEGVLLKKPVITFGSVFYNELSMVKHSDNIEELPNLVKECLENYLPNDEELVNFLSAIFENSLPLNYFDLWQEGTLKEILSNKEFQKFVDFLAKRLEL